MSRSNRLSLVKSLLGFILCTVIIAVGDNLNAQQPFGGRPRYTQPTPLSNVINNQGEGPDDLSITADGLALFWGAALSGQTRGEQIWTATRPTLDSEWENVHVVGEGVFTGLRNMDPAVTADGLEIYFRTSDVALEYNSTHVNDRLMMATRSSTTSPWSDAVELQESINELHCVNKPSITGDGLELYFSSTDTCNGRAANIYVSKRSGRGDEWGEPELVETLAWTPGISPDGLQLLFMEGDRSNTNLPNGTFGNGPSVFVRTRSSRDDEFGPAIELGEPPNTASAFFAVWGPDLAEDGTLYFTSDRSGVPKDFGAWQATLAEPCDINADGSCDVNDLTQSSLYSVNLIEGSELESDILNFDISGDGRVDKNDLAVWLVQAASTNGFQGSYFRGDSNLDGEFNSGDLTVVFQAGEYEDNITFNSSWAEGDWNGDGDFDSGDLVAAFQDGGYEMGPRVAANAVPEPSSWVLLGLALVGIDRIRRSTRVGRGL